MFSISPPSTHNHTLEDGHDDTDPPIAQLPRNEASTIETTNEHTLEDSDVEDQVVVPIAPLTSTEIPPTNQHQRDMAFDRLMKIDFSKSDPEDTASAQLDVVISNISPEAWNRFTELDDITTKYMWYCIATKQVFIIELPTAQHETTTNAIVYQMMHAMPNQLIAVGSTTFRGNDGICRQPDGCFVPQHTPPPHAVSRKEFVTFVIEVGVSQGWQDHGGKPGLHTKGHEWFAYHPTVEYVLLVRVSKGLLVMEVELWKRNTPNAGVQVSVRQNFRPADVEIALETRCLLGLQPNTPLPQHVPATINIAMAQVRAQLEAVIG